MNANPVWNVGDKAVYTPCDCPSCVSEANPLGGPTKGSVYEFIGFGLAICASGRGLMFAGLENRTDGWPVGWCAADWCKIRPDEHEPCEQEFCTLLKLSKQRVSA